MPSNSLEFQELRLRNFLSFGAKETVVPLSGDYITVVLGENRDTGGEDSRNGVGKSAIIDALCYALFGKVVRGISNQKLINKLSAKGAMIVSVRFTKGEYQYLVERTERPSKLFLFRQPLGCDEDFRAKDGRKLKYDISRGKNETTEQIIGILGFDITLFEFLVANTSESIEFFRLTEEKRREIIEHLFGFTIMTEKAKMLKDDRKEKNKELLTAESAAEATKAANARIENQAKELEAKESGWESQRKKAIAELNEMIETLEAVDTDAEITVLKEIDKITSEMKDLKAKVREMESEQKAREREMKSQKREAERSVVEITTAEKEIEALDNSECPTCHQHWEPDPSVREAAKAKLDTAQSAGTEALEQFEILEKQIEEAQPLIDGEHGNLSVLEETLEEFRAVKLTYDSIEEAASAGAQLQGLREKLEASTEETNPHAGSAAKIRQEAIEEIDESEISSLRSLIQHYTFLIDLLTKKDSFLRKRIIDRWMPILNRRISYWLEVLELPHTVTFQPDLTVEIEDYHEQFDFGNLSKGERNRIRIALNFAFQDVFEFMNYKISLLAVDELIDSGICPRGAENAVRALYETCGKKHKRAFLITHRDDIAARVDDVMHVIKENRQSRIEHGG